MKIFIDTADLDQIIEAFSWGIVDGVTTNPSLIKQAVDALKKKGTEINMGDYIQRILQVAKETPVSLEVIGLTEADMFFQAELLYNRFRQDGNIVIKIPINPASNGLLASYNGLKVSVKLAEKSIPTNVTLVMTPEQALLAAKAGATYVSPFAGRIDDYLRDREGEKYNKPDYYPAKRTSKHDNGIVSGVDLVAKIMRIYDRYDFETQVIAASVRNARQARELAETGVDIATIPFDVLQQMMVHTKTAEGMRKFTADVVPEYAALFR